MDQPFAEEGLVFQGRHHRIGDEADLVDYRDMVLILRDRIASMIAKGMTLEQIMATKPTVDYDLRYGTAAYTPAMFVAAVYRDLTQRKGGK